MFGRALVRRNALVDARVWWCDASRADHRHHRRRPHPPASSCRFTSSQSKRALRRAHQSNTPAFRARPRDDPPPRASFRAHVGDSPDGVIGLQIAVGRTHFEKKKTARTGRGDRPTDRPIVRPTDRPIVRPTDRGPRTATVTVGSACVFILFGNSPDDPATTHLDSTLARLEN